MSAVEQQPASSSYQRSVTAGTSSPEVFDQISRLLKEPLAESIDNAVAYIRRYKHVFDLHVADYYVDGHKSIIPDAWHGAADKLGSDIFLPMYLEEASSIAASQGLVPIPKLDVKADDLPESLRSFWRQCRRVSLSRGNVGKPDDIPKLKKHSGVALVQNMNPKKIHEVSYLCNLLRQICDRVGTDLVCDMGSGKGYLAHYVSSVTGLNCLAIEKQRAVHEAACQRWRKLCEWMNKHGEIRRGDVLHVCGLLDGDNCVRADICGVSEQSEADCSGHLESFKSKGDGFTVQELRVLFKLAYPSPSGRRASLGEPKQSSDKTVHDLNNSSANVQGSSALEGMVMTGLHTCGQLNVDLLRSALSNGCKAVVVVPCCFHRTHKSTEPPEFPVSKLLADMGGLQLSQHILEAGSHGLDKVMEAVACQGSPALGKLAVKVVFRAAAEIVIRKLTHQQGGKHSKTGHITVPEELCSPADKGARDAFLHFVVHQVFPSMDEGLVRKESNTAWDVASRDMWGPYLLHVMRVRLSTVIESLVIWDRAQLCREQGMQSAVVPLLNAAVSPRCFALVALENSCTLV